MKEDKVLKKLIQLDEYVREKLVTYEEFDKSQKENGKLLEHITITVNRLDSDRLANRAELDRHEKDIKVLKKRLSLS